MNGRSLTREERKRNRRAARRDVILIALALVVIPIVTGYLVEWIMPAVRF